MNSASPCRAKAVLTLTPRQNYPAPESREPRERLHLPSHLSHQSQTYLRPFDLTLLGFTIFYTTPSSSGTTTVAQKPARSYSLKTKKAISTTTNGTGVDAIDMPLPR